MPPRCWQNVAEMCKVSKSPKARPVEEFLQVIENKWRRCMGIEPTEPTFRGTPLDLKSRPATRPDSPPQRSHCSSPLRQLDRPEFSIRLTSLEYFLELGA